jgi:tetratricopeptide (TPR) repeat protein
MKRVILFISLCLCMSACKSIWLKSAARNEKIADAYLLTNQYAHAIKFYEKALKHHNTPALAFKIGDSYLLTRDFVTAKSYYTPYLQNHAMKPSNIRQYAVLAMCTGDYRISKIWWKKYADTTGVDVAIKIAACDSAMQWLNHKNGSQIIQNLKSINSSYSDISPTFYNTGLVFASSRHGIFIEKESGSTGEPYFDLYESHSKNDTLFQKPSFFSRDINTPEHETAAFFDTTGSMIYYTRGETDTTNTLKIKILQSTKTSARSWTKPKQFVLNDSTASFGQPFISRKENVFIFSSNLPGGYGGTDLYISFKKDNSWSLPENLGPGINSAGNEYYPFLTEKGDLYFTSDGHIGMGGYDLYVAKFGTMGWSEIENLKSPINSCADDLSFILSRDGKVAYYSSNREGGMGKEDLYKITFR